MKINLPKALKIKNRIVGELNRVRALIRRDNQIETTNMTGEEVQAHIKGVKNLINVEASLFESLIMIKTFISKANIDIYEKIARMAELKSQMGFVQSLPSRDGQFIENEYGRPEPIKRNFLSVVNQKSIDLSHGEMQHRIDRLQDEIDEYNATTLIEIPDPVAEQAK